MRTIVFFPGALLLLFLITPSVSLAATLPTQPSSNVLFIPGIEGSRLYTRSAFGTESTVWEPSLTLGITSLALNPDGTSQHTIYTRDLVDYKYRLKVLGDVYGPFEKFMDGLVSNGTIAKWQAYPYDWRYDVEDIVENGTLVGNSTGKITTVFLQGVLENLAATSPSGKVTIIAHSNGGLLAKALILELQKEHRAELVDHLIFIATPQLGTPLSIGSMLNGDGQTDPTGGLIMYGGTARIVSKTLPSMYGLLPSVRYFSTGAIPILFSGNSSDNIFAKAYGSSIESFDDFEDFLTDSAQLLRNFSAGDLRVPIALSSALLTKEFILHSRIDSWNPPPTLQFSSISGWGNPTPLAYSYFASLGKTTKCLMPAFLIKSCNGPYQANHEVTNSLDGDDTVLTSSASASTLDRYYFNAQAYAAAKLGKYGHGNITSANPIQIVLQDMLTHKTVATPFITTSIPGDFPHPMIVANVGPSANFIVTDKDGNQSGIFPIPGKIGIYYKKEEIPDSSIQVLGDDKYVYLPEGQPYTISLQGYEPGLSYLHIGMMDTNGISHFTNSYDNIPATAQMKATVSLVSSSSTANFSTPLVLPVDITGLGTNVLIQKTELQTTSI